MPPYTMDGLRGGASESNLELNLEEISEIARSDSGIESSPLLSITRVCGIESCTKELWGMGVYA